jgi:hypothetical protein
MRNRCGPFAVDPAPHRLRSDVQPAGKLHLAQVEPLEGGAQLLGRHAPKGTLAHGVKIAPCVLARQVLPFGMAIRRCGWCGSILGLAPGSPDGETTGICDGCGVRLVAESAISHALVGVRAVEQELERALGDVWKRDDGTAIWKM